MLLMEKKLVKVAVVGCGHLGKLHAEKYSKIPSVVLSAVCDLDESKGKELAGLYGSTFAGDYRELLSSGLDAVSIASDTTSHYEIAKFFLTHGVDVLVEKPICVTKSEGDELVSIARKKNKILQVGHVERFNPVIEAVKKHIHMPWFFEIKRIAPFKPRGIDVDVILDVMIHDVDLLLDLVKKPIVSIYAVGMPVFTRTIDVANARIEFEEGTVANVTASRAAHTAERSMRIFQPDNYVKMDFLKRTLRISKKTDCDEGLSEKPLLEDEELNIEPRDALLDEISEFVQCVRDRVLPRVTGEDGVRAIEVATHIKESIRTFASRAQNVPRQFLEGLIE